MVDWRGGLDKVVDGAARGLDKGKELLGEGVDAATDKVGAGLDKVGAHDWADKVEDWGDETASSLGAEVGEKQLGQSEEANELIHGRPEKITATVKNLRDFQRAFDLVGGGMKKLDSGNWRGEAADTFRAKFSTLPTDWLRAADSFEDAAKALETYASAVTSAQSKARAAIALYKEGTQDSEKAVAAFNKKVDAYNAARNGDDPLPHPGTFADPGVSKRKRAQDDLEDARRIRNEAGGRAESAVTAAMAHAPKEPKGAARLKNELYDYGLSQGVELAHLGGGALKGVGGLMGFLRQTNPIDPYNLTHPAEMYKGVSMTLSGLTRTVANPDRALESAWEAAKGDPSEFVGRLLPEAVGTKGAGALKGGLRAGLRKGGGPEGPQKPPGPAREGHEESPNSNGKQCNEVKCAGDPIDVATGRMLMPQTDIALPGSLPLVFSRVFDSSYRSGHWFGTGWSSTVDQRLEIDAQGVVFTCDQGSLLAYPHPAPGVPVMPTHGRQWPLDRVPDGFTITDPESGQVLHFADQNPDLALLAQIDDRNGRWIAFEYDEAGAPTSIVHHGGYHLKLTTAEGRVTALHLAGAAPDGTDQEILRYAYTDGHLAAVTNSSGLPLRFDCDDLGRITAWTDTNDSRYEYVYDDLDRCVYQSGTNGHLEASFTWDGTDPETGLRMTSMTDGLGHTTRYVINDRAQVVTEIDALGSVTRFEYDRHHRLLAHTDPLGHVSRSRYDEQGRLVSVIRPDGREATADYNELGLPIHITNPDRTVVRQGYDNRGNRTTVSGPSAAITRTTYDSAGHPTSITDALGSTTHIHSNAAGLPVEITDPLGATKRIERDAFGRPSAVTDPLGAITRFVWTPQGKLAQRTDADGSIQSWTYDGEGNCLTHTDAMGSVTQFEYTHFDLVAARTGPDGVRYEFTHDHELRLTQVLNPQGLTWTYVYDPVGGLISEIDFDDRTLSYTRDAAGRLTTRTNALGQTTCYERDKLGRIVRKDADGAVATFAYDLTDQLAEAVNADATVNWLRDEYGHLKSETVNGQTLTYAYDGLGRRIGRETPSGSISTWAYDPAGRRTSLTTSGRTLTFEHDAAGQETVRHVGEHVTIASQFDAMGRLTTQQVTGLGRSIQRRDYNYRADGQLVGLTDQRSGTKTFDVDTVGRVTAVNAANWTERYVYDAAGNQTTASWPTRHLGQEAAGDRSYTGTAITRAGNIRYEHDALGRVTLRQKARLSGSRETWRYAWDSEDRLASVITPSGARWRYRYDPLGRRIAKELVQADEVVERVSFTWDGLTLCEQISFAESNTNPICLTWDHDGFRPLSQTERILGENSSTEAIDERFFSVITDIVGTPTELVEESGSLAWHTLSTLWGTTTWAAASIAYTPLRFPGQYFDPETGLHYNFNRHYDPETGRYLTPDPLGLAPSPNPNTYVINPHSGADPLGLSPCPDVPIYKAPGKGMTDRLLQEGFQESDFPGSGNGYPDGKAYFGLADEGKTIAFDYASRGGYDGGVIEIRIPKADFDQYFREHIGSHNGVPNTEVAIPNTLFDRLNQYPRILVEE
ncbi:putative T7SS-secreted protein [Streptomyces globisporus]|uniref:putative T7SS-secreted protein n=1 Tax=Streptomyces globisporus TaxID=1908 RepID=UPI003665EC9D